MGKKSSYSEGTLIMNLKLIIYNPYQENKDIYFRMGSTTKSMTGYEPLTPKKKFQFKIYQYFTEICLRKGDIENKIQLYWENKPFSEIEIWGDKNTFHYYGNNETVVIIIKSNPGFVPGHRFDLIAPKPIESIPTEHETLPGISLL